MVADARMRLFVFKSTYRRKCHYWNAILFCVVVYSHIFNLVFCANCTNVKCVNGLCVDGTGCICSDGWRGPSCQFCSSKVRLSDTNGYIHDGPGNYTLDAKCSWLVYAGDHANTTIHLHLEEFATECGWDHLYIFDGDSVDSPVLAVFSGLMYTDRYNIRRIPEVVARSGSVLLHFYSDVAYNMTGFNISYRLNSCPSQYSSKECSGHGICNDGVCTCNALFIGEACHVPVCPNNCSNSQGTCNEEKRRCDCKRGFKGDDCSQGENDGYWEVVQSTFVPKGSASHGAVIWKDSMYIVAGKSYQSAEMINVYDFNENVWEIPHMDNKKVPHPRYGHSTVLYEDKIYMYGGVLENYSISPVSAELWAFDVKSETWENITVRTEPCNSTGANILPMCEPLKVAGHTATLVTGRNQEEDKMVVIFGHSPKYGYLNTVQEYQFGTHKWSVVTTKGYPIKGGYGHTSAFDSYSKYIYVYGGIISESSLSCALSNRLYSYDPISRIWTLLSPAPSARTLHSAAFAAGGLMLVFGGNTHNDTSYSQGAKCYSSDMLAYDITCDQWSTINVPSYLRADLARFGHSAVTFEGSLYIFGGFDGQMLSDMLKYTPGKCQSLVSDVECISIKPGIKCIWEQNNERCVPLSPTIGDLIKCSNDPRIFPFQYPGDERCFKEQDCRSCVQTSFKCGWSEGKCRVLQRRKGGASGAVTSLEQCEPNEGSVCHQLHSCPACSSQPLCYWEFGGVRCKPIGNATTREMPKLFNWFIDVDQETTFDCPPNCADFTSCQMCTMEEECMWCQNEERCVDKNAYTASFPYGLCREWTAHRTRCRTPVKGKSQCSVYTTCGACREDPACGWCDDGFGTGHGSCMSGGNSRPTPKETCPSKRWFFTGCPLCQCNGHSTCAKGTNICLQPCANLTHGPHCENCVSGFYGSALNGGKCNPCKCNDQGTECHPETGKCICTTKGIVGDHCERCDVYNHYYGDPNITVSRVTTSGETVQFRGSCFYDLTTNYQFTFSLSKKTDSSYTQINFKNSPTAADIDVKFNINCSVNAKFNITIKKPNTSEKDIVTVYNCSTFETRFSKADHMFGVEGNITFTTFYVYVYDFHSPLQIQVSFAQYPKLNLQQFFITLSTCFLFLLLVAAGSCKCI